MEQSSVAEPPAPAETTLEALDARHRKEAHEAIAHATALKKTVPKGDTKRKKAVALQIASLDAARATRVDAERAALLRALADKDEVNGVEPKQDAEESSLPARKQDPGESEASLARLTLDPRSAHDSKDAAHAAPADPPARGKKPNRQQQRKQRKAAEFEAQKRLAAAEASSMDNLKDREQTAIQAKLAPRGLHIHDIPADGHCLYNAIAHQYARVHPASPAKTYQDMRRTAARYMREHPDDFAPFLVNDQQEPLAPGEFEQYCAKIETQPVWGGQLEVQALAQSLGVPIEITQYQGEPLYMGDDSSPEAKNLLRISYHQHYYGLGAHYNSLI